MHGARLNEHLEHQKRSAASHWGTFVISRENRRDFAKRGLRAVRGHVEHADFSPQKHREAEEWIDEQDHRSTNKRANLALVISIIAALAALIPLVIQYWGPVLAALRSGPN